MALVDAVPFVVAAWSLDEASGTRLDSVGSNDLSDNNTVTSNTGKLGVAADFELDNSEYLSHASDTALVAGDIDFMIRCWVKLESDATVQSIIIKGGFGDTEYRLSYNSFSDRFRFDVYSSTGFGGAGNVVADNFGVPSIGVWYLIHAWHDSINNQLGIAVNAGTANTSSHSTGIYAGSGPFTISDDGLSSTSFDGLIDDVILIKDYIFSDAERSEDYNGSSGVTLSQWDYNLDDAFPSIVSAWNLDETSGTRVDSIGNNDLTDNNTVLSATGMFDNAADFEIDNVESLTCVDHADLSGGNIDLMVRAWVKLESKPSGSAAIIAKDGDGSNTEYVLYWDNTSDRFKWVCWSLSNGDGGNTVTASNFGSPSTGVWYLLHAWHDSVNDIIGISVNAGEANINSHTGGVYNSNSDFKIGNSSNSFIDSMDGLIDDAIFIRNYFLNAAQRNLDYNSGAGVTFAEWLDIVYEQEGFRFRFDNGSETTATWMDSQDTNISAAIETNTRLRILTDVAGDAPSQALKLQYRKVGDTTWRTIGTV